ncbi:lamin tail domain-containing protein [Flavivirga jejuensis]|uniref:Lamin tail domain-containing protein n=1 Tax=Flavivirga jejuensis TaxID=870487 RepID=A0ABT8WL17_9FLAO|nr:lamin tail domain-containing protein [Flavivirga jejuensis]MDO5973851.1 lamin tail domain-containing protein [Flavivirga jejuensis]
MTFNLKLTSFFNLSKIKTSALAFFISLGFLGNSQILINEASNKNLDQIFDEDNENEDWIELFNSGENTVNIKDWSITDNNSKVTKWVFPDLEMAPKSHVLIFASGKDRTIEHGSKWESAILPSDIFSYIIPDANVPANWNTLAFDASSWSTGSAGFGYGDDDDTTILPTGTLVTYVRKHFIVTNLNALVSGICHVDYDDGFVAYINGIEICRSNVAGTPTWNSTATDTHEAVVPNGENPEGFVIDPNIFASALQEGENVFSIEVHNISDISSDLSLSPYLSFSFNGDNTYFSESPVWVGIDGDTELHTNFKISSEGEIVYLYNDSQELIDFMAVDIQTLNFSVGREKDGIDGLAFFEGATPGTTNNNATAYLDGYEEMPLFSMPAGYHTSTLNVSITSTSSTVDQVRYTLDGSEPTITSPLYNGTPITLTNSTTINARAFSTVDKLPSPVNTNTYIINETFSVPVLSVTTDNSNLFDDDDGIFTNFWESWNKPCYIEYFEPDGTLAFQQKAGIQVDGGFGGSRHEPQTSFRIEPGNGIYGDGDLEYSFHPNRPNRDNYASLYLRNGSNRYLDLLYKDAAQVRGMGEGTNNFYSEYRPIVVFINGEYYGMYEGREKINADYLESNYNMDTDSLDLVGISAFNQPQTVLANEGSVEPFFEDYNKFLAMDTSSATYLEDVGEFLDLDNYTDYMAAQTWMTNKDWPQNNMKAWRCVGSDMRWQFALIDLEWSFLPTNVNSPYGLDTRPDFDQIEYMNNLGTQWHASGYWYMLMQNDDYKHHFINRLCDLMNTSYAYEELDKIETEMFDEAWPEIPAYYERWNGGDVSKFQSNHEDFNNELSTRETYLREHLRDHYSLNNDVEVNLDVVGYGTIKISTISPESYPWDGDYFSDVPITIEAIPNPGYQFVRWQANDLITDQTKSDFTVDLGASAEVSFIAEFEMSSEPFTEVTITEINYKDGDDFETTDWFEIYNGTSSTINLDGWYFLDSDDDHRYDFESQVEIQPDGYLVVARYTEQFIENYPSVTNMVGDFDFGLGSDDAIRLYNADDELVVEVEYSDDAPWPLNEDDTGRTLELDQYTQDLSDSSAWFSGCFKGSPGSAFVSNCNLSVNNKVFSDAVSVSPNPVTNILNIITTSGVELKHAKLYSTLGKELVSSTTSSQLDASSLPSGMYILKIESTDGEIQTKKIIKK